MEAVLLTFLSGTTTGRHEFSRGVFEFCFARQSSNGYVPIAGPMGSAPVPIPPSGTLPDYEMLFLNSLYAYYENTGDLSFMRKYWSQTKRVIAAVLLLINPNSGLVAGSGEISYWLGPANGTAVSSVLCHALRQMVRLATDLGDHNAASEYATHADSLGKAVQNLWSETLGTFALSTASPNDYSIAGIAFAILSGIASAEQSERSIMTALPKLFEEHGYRDQFSVEPSPETWISPNTNGYLLEAVLQTAVGQSMNKTRATQLSGSAKLMIAGLWGQMTHLNENYTGAVWESIGFDGKPLSLAASLSHPWSSAPSYILPEYVLGLRASGPGWKSWTLQPFAYGLDLTWASGKRQTPYGEISASWELQGKRLIVSVKAPQGTSGVVSVGDSIIKVKGGRLFRTAVLLK